MSKAALARYVEPAAMKLAGEMGLSLVDVELTKESAGRFLRFYIDKEGGVSLTDCEAYHRAIVGLMEGVDYDYMEVCSPGADRPLKKPEDFEKARGKLVEVRLYKALDGLKRYTGELKGLIAGRVVIEAGGERAFELSQVAQVAPLIEFDEEALKDVFDQADE